MFPSVSWYFILPSFSNIPVKSNFSKCSSWKLQQCGRMEHRDSMGWSREFLGVARRHSWETAFSICLWDYAQKPNPADFPI